MPTDLVTVSDCDSTSQKFKSKSGHIRFKSKLPRAKKASIGEVTTRETSFAGLHDHPILIAHHLPRDHQAISTLRVSEMNLNSMNLQMSQSMAAHVNNNNEGNTTCAVPVAARVPLHSTQSSQHLISSPTSGTATSQLAYSSPEKSIDMSSHDGRQEPRGESLNDPHGGPAAEAEPSAKDYYWLTFVPFQSAAAAASGHLRPVGLVQSYALLVSICCLIFFCTTLIYRNNAKNEEICVTTECVISASSIIQDMDRSVNPCDDFYSFACNGFVGRHTPLPDGIQAIGPFPEAQNAINARLKAVFEETREGEPSHMQPPSISPAESSSGSMEWVHISRRSELFGKLKRFYSSCIDKDGKSAALDDTHLKRYLSELGGWPPLSPANTSFDNFDLTDAIIKLYQIGFLYEFYVGLEVEPDHYDNSLYILQVTQGLRSTSARTLKSPFNSSESQSFLAYMIRVAVKMGADETTARNDLIQAYQLDRQLSMLELPLGRIAKSYNVMSIDNLYQLAPIIDWSRLIHTLTSGRLMLPTHASPQNHHRGRLLNGTMSTKIIVHHPNFVALAARILSSVPRRILAAYVGWYATLQGVQWMGSEWRTLRHKLPANCPAPNSDSSTSDGPNGGSSSANSRWRSCTNQMQRWLGLGVAHFYLKRYVAPDAATEIREMIGYLKNELIATLHGAGWMDETTKANAIWKAENVIAIAGHSAELLNGSLLAGYYQDVDFTEENYFQNRLTLQKWSREKNFALLGTVGSRDDWRQESKTLAVNAYHTWNQNKLAIAAGLMQGVFYGSGRQRYLNYGALGSLAAHEFIHGFDIVGRRYSAVGNLENWWNMNTTRSFYSRAECFLAQYGRQTFHGLALDGAFTLAENIADNGGINLAYRAYRRYVADKYGGDHVTGASEPKLPGLPYSGNQLFWISFARVWCLSARTDHLNVSLFSDPHSPNPIRTNVALSNSADFARDWSCPLGSRMNPLDKCALW